MFELEDTESITPAGHVTRDHYGPRAKRAPGGWGRDGVQ